MEKEELKIPSHVAIICDGNGRWATNQNLPRWKGHEEGFKNAKRITKYAFSKGVKYLSLYLFSTENFKRPKKEVDYIMSLLVDKLKEILDFCHEEKIKAIVSGRDDNLSPKVLSILNRIAEETKNYDNIFNMCFNYGGKAEIIDATMKFAKDYKENEIELTEEIFNKYLYQDLPPVDLLIRTSGEKRISNFMLWQCAYSEFYFTDTYFPSFKEEEFDEALKSYKSRERRYGGLKDENKNN